MNQTIFVSDRDERRLRRLLETHRPSGEADRENHDRLAAELDRARIVPENELAPDIVALGSVVEVEDLDDGEILTCTLVLPPEADASLGRVSILAPLGTGMLGCRAGDTFKWPVPGGVLRARIRRAAQPQPGVAA